nr:hydantoinase/oxoprolinase N-terminal domain-containing protein [Bacillus subtilis]
MAIVISAFLMFLGFITLAVGSTLSSIFVVTAGLFLFGAGSGMCNVAMNLEGTEIEYRIKKTILPILHASFSIGTLIGAGAGILFIHLGISVLNHLLVIALLFFLSIFICTRYIPHGTGRLIHDGTIKKPLHLQQLDHAVQQVISKGLAGIVISFLHSYQNPVHELQAKAYIKHHYPQLEVLTSSELWPQMREYERTVMSVVNLYIQPKVKQYLQTLKSRLKEEGVPISPYITQSNGGLMDAESAADSPVKTPKKHSIRLPKK